MKQTFQNLKTDYCILTNNEQKLNFFHNEQMQAENNHNSK